MALQPESKQANIAKSLTQWIREKLVTAEGLSVFFAHEVIASRPAQWVHVDYLLGIRSEFGGIVGTRLGGRGHSILNMNLCLRRDELTNIYAMEHLRDKVAPYFQVGQGIPFRDYEAGGNPVTGAIQCGASRQLSIDDGLGSGVIVDVFAVDLTLYEAFTLA